MPRHVEAPRLLVDVGDPQNLTGRVGMCEALGEKLPRCREATKLQRKFGTLITHALATRR
jgi:hypothetical protein